MALYMRLGLIALGSMTVWACNTDTQLSLGHHDPMLVAGEDGGELPPPIGGMRSMMAGTSGAGAGGAGAGVSGASTGGAGGMEMDPPLFDGGAGTPPMQDGGMLEPNPCGAGTYLAQLECVVSNGVFGPPGGPPPSPMSTTATFTIEPISGRPGLASVSAPFSALAWDTQFEARLVGQLDCVARTLHADILDGTFGPEMPIGGAPGGDFVGMLDAQLDPNSGDLFGVWFHTPQGGGARCNGMWTAAAVSP